MAAKRLRRAAAMALALGSVSALVACSGPVAVGEGGDADATLIYDLGLEMTTLDPAAVFDVSASIINAQVYEQLVGYATDSDEIEGELAESWERNDDATEYRFVLRDDVAFESGGELSSADVEFSFNRLKNLQGGSAYLMDGITVASEDERTVVVSSEVPKPELLAMLATQSFSVYDSAAVQERGGLADESAATEDTAGDAFFEESFGSGAYALASYEPNAEVELVASESWRGDAPDFAKVLVRNSRSIQQQTLNIQNGGSDVTNSLSSPQVAELDAESVNVISQPLPQVIYFALTNSGGPTVNDDFRRAVALGIDYDGIVEMAGEGARQGTGVIPTTLAGAIPEGEGLQRDVEAAKAALAASGMADQPLSISFGSDYAVGGQDMGLFAQKIQSDLEEIGMTVELDGAPTQVSRTANQEGKVQAALWPFPPDYADASQFLIHSPGGLLAERIHWTAEEAPEIVALADAAQHAVDDADRAAAYEAWARALRDTNRFIAVVEVPQNLVTSKRVGSLNMDVAGEPQINLFTLEQ
ncbi:ABC transporter substrate-binding protein [Leucobacter allii]|uniref:ABC transporter substrate-binding protein n=1 Tax=Leucobacter allii TaxID=2932247 RepID=A0ABY4FKS4_9MICO|nr:ABC transporter substrate-binding protein [Leucobacter allii]UOQ56858.1 ABC transporter substrate-binding protein [Leucobacter allii]